MISVIPEDFTEAILKIDIEDSEFIAFKNAELLFKRVKIHAVFFEWQRKARFPFEEIVKFLGFMFTRKFKVFDLFLNPLKPEDWKEWPGDIIFIHEDFKF